MDKNLRKSFFLICLTGGILFSVIFFLLFGAAYGYSLKLSVICFCGGLFFALAVYFISILTAKPHSFENPKAQKKLSDYETIRNAPYECKFPAYTKYGSGLKQEICETCVYFETDKIHIAYCHFGKIYSFDIPYPEIDRTWITKEDVLLIDSTKIGYTACIMKSITPKLKETLINKGVYKEPDDLELIYNIFNGRYNLIFTNTFALNDGYTIDVPVIRGSAADRRFDLYKDEDEFVFSVEFFNKTGQERYSHSHPSDLGDAIDLIEKFMSGKSIFDQ